MASWLHCISIFTKNWKKKRFQRNPTFPFFYLLFMYFRQVDWTHSRWTVCMMMEHTELPSSLFMELQPQIHLRYKAHLLYLMALLLLHQFKWRQWLNSRPIPLHHTQPTRRSNRNKWCLVRPILSLTQDLGHFPPTILPLILILKLTTTLSEAPAYCNNIWVQLIFPFSFFFLRWVKQQCGSLYPLHSIDGLLVWAYGWFVCLDYERWAQRLHRERCIMSKRGMFDQLKQSGKPYFVMIINYWINVQFDSCWIKMERIGEIKSLRIKLNIGSNWTFGLLGLNFSQ